MSDLSTSANHQRAVPDQNSHADSALRTSERHISSPSSWHGSELLEKEEHVKGHVSVGVVIWK